jgi:cellulose synthase (UDP-forming)
MHTKFPASLTRKRRFDDARTTPAATRAGEPPRGGPRVPAAGRIARSAQRALRPRRPRGGATEIARGRAAIIAVLLGWTAWLAVVIVRRTGFDGAPWSVIDRALSLTGLTFCALALLVYLAARQGALVRLNEHVRVPRSELERHFSARQDALTVLVSAGDGAGTGADAGAGSSARPGSRALRASLWSAALQEYPTLRVVLLLDARSDPGAQAEALRSVRQLTDALAEPRARFADALFVLELELAWNLDVTEDLVDALAADYRWAVAWLSRQRLAEPVTDRSSAVFDTHTLGGPAADFARVAADLDRAISEHIPQSPERMLRLQRRLAWTFSVELEIFDGSLASYVDLIRTSSAGDVAEADYLLTLGPDAQLLSDYSLRSIYFLDEPAHSDVAVFQTPSFSQVGPRSGRKSPGFRGLLHRSASRYGASFWVGSTALIRASALGDFRAGEPGGVVGVLAEADAPRGVDSPANVAPGASSRSRPDSVSAIGLGVRGWTLANFPERLSFSTAAPGFGSVIVQHRRPLLGDAVVLPRIWRQLRREFGAWRSVGASGRSPRRAPR